MLTVAVLTNLARSEFLLETLRSLARAGLPTVHLHSDTAQRGHAHAYLEVLASVAPPVTDPAGWILLCEDDIAVPVGLGRYLDAVCERLALHRGRLGFATLYCSVGYRDWVAAHPVRGAPAFGRLIPNDGYAGTQCILFPAPSLARLLATMRHCHREHPDFAGDRLLGHAAERERLEAWCHLPSLVDHRGRLESTVGSRADNLAMLAANYVGDAWRGVGSWKIGAGDALTRPTRRASAS